MNQLNRDESAKLNNGAKWVIRQLLLEIESRGVKVELYDAAPDGFIIYYRLISGDDSLVNEFAGKLSIRKEGNRLEVQHG